MNGECNENSYEKFAALIASSRIKLVKYIKKNRFRRLFSTWNQNFRVSHLAMRIVNVTKNRYQRRDVNQTMIQNCYFSLWHPFYCYVLSVRFLSTLQTMQNQICEKRNVCHSVTQRNADKLGKKNCINDISKISYFISNVKN